MTEQNNPKINLPAIAELIREIEEKSADAEYIYRGEPKDYGKISSSLFRDYTEEINTEGFDMEKVQEEILSEAKKHTDENKTDTQILSELQHYGGKTNLIDFTTDYRIALFFACDGETSEAGRVILKKKKPLQDDNQITAAQNPPHRVIAQKSVFVRPPEGYIDVDPEKEIINIPKEQKEEILNYLRKYHGISTETIYNDLHGFIRKQELHKSAYTEFHKGRTSALRGGNASTEEEKQKEYNKAIEYYNEAIRLMPNHAVIYSNRGLIYNHKGAFDKAIDDFNQAIELNPNFADAYNNRGVAYGNKGEHDKAIANFNKTIELKPDYTEAYNNRGIAYGHKGEHDKAINAFNKAIELKPNYAEAYYNRGIAQRELKQYKVAKKDLQTALALAEQQRNAPLAADSQKTIADLPADADE